MMNNVFHVLTVIFVVCKLAHVSPVDQWSWWLVFAPSLIGIGLALLMCVVVVLAAIAKAYVD